MDLDQIVLIKGLDLHLTSHLLICLLYIGYLYLKQPLGLCDIEEQILTHT